MDNPKQTSKKSSTNSNAYLQYSGMVFQMAAAILIGLLIGKRLDAWFANQRPIWTPICSILFFAAGFYLSIKDLLVKK